MRLQDCTGCPFSKKTIPHTKPLYLCSYGRYKDTPEGGYPCVWIKDVNTTKMLQKQIHNILKEKSNEYRTD